VTVLRYPLSSHVKALRFRGLRPQGLGPFHRHRALRACPPLIIDLVARPHHQRGDLRRIADRVQGLTAHEARCLTLRGTVSIQDPLALGDASGLRPVMGQPPDHEPLPRTAAPSPPATYGSFLAVVSIAAPASSSTAVESHVPCTS